MTYTPETIALDTAAIAALNDNVRRAEEALAEGVRVCRDKGLPWSRIGDALGTTRQAAHQRFGGSPVDGAPLCPRPCLGVSVLHPAHDVPEADA